MTQDVNLKKYQTSQLDLSIKIIPSIVHKSLTQFFDCFGMIDDVYHCVIRNGS
jgi:hypothetical protein